MTELHPLPIHDPDDPRVADYRHLTDAALRRAVEAPGDGGEGIFIAEGRLVVAQLLRSPYRPRSFLVADAQLPALLELLAGAPTAPFAPIHVASPAVMAAVAGFHVHRGLLAAADRRPLPDLAPMVGGTRVLVALEGINDHENMGAVFRNGAALGADAVVLDPRCCDPLYRRSVRVSMGQALRVPYTVTEPWPAALGRLRAAGFEVVAFTPDAGAAPIDRFEPAGPVALVFGAEGAGLSATTLAAADRRVRIPISDAVDSLNIATAAAIALHHVAGRVSPAPASAQRRSMRR